MTLPKATISPQDIYDEISKKVVGQHEAKREISLSLYMHYIGLLYKEANGGQKPGMNNNILLHGASGNGKTFLVQTAVKAMRDLTGLPIFPLLEVDASTLTSEGWSGTSISDLLDLHMKTVSETALPTTIVYFDEFDKLVNPAVGSGGTDHNKTTMYSLLKFVEGTKYNISGTSSRWTKNVDTSDFLFIFSGNFSALRQEEDERDKPSMGLVNLNTIDPDKVDIFTTMQKIGLATQMAGRIGKIIRINRLTENELESIIRQNIIPELQELLRFMDYTHHISEDIIQKMVKTAIKRKTGARGLNSSLNELIKDFLFSTQIPLISPYDTPSLEVYAHGKPRVDIQVFTQEILDDDWTDPGGVMHQEDTEDYTTSVPPEVTEDE